MNKYLYGTRNEKITDFVDAEVIKFLWANWNKEKKWWIKRLNHVTNKGSIYLANGSAGEYI